VFGASAEESGASGAALYGAAMGSAGHEVRDGEGEREGGGEREKEKKKKIKKKKKKNVNKCICFNM